MANPTQQDLSIRPLTARQKIALQMILDGARKLEVCERLNITEKTLWNWRQLPAWEATLDVVLKVDNQDGDALVESFYPQAINILRKLALTGNDTVKLAAVRTIIEARQNIIIRRDDREMMQAMEAQLSELQVQVSNQQAAANTPVLEPAQYAEFVTVSNESANGKVVITDTTES